MEKAMLSANVDIDKLGRLVVPKRSGIRRAETHRLPPPAATTIIHQIRQRVRAVSLTEAEYASTVEDIAARRLVGAIIYDALLLRCADS